MSDTLSSPKCYSVRYIFALLPILAAYFMLDNDGVTPGLKISDVGAKTAIKIGAILLLMSMVGVVFRPARIREIVCWLGLGLPIAMFGILSIVTGDKLYLQAVNAVLFLPILAINWRNREHKFMLLFGSISRIMVMQVVASVLFSGYIASNWENRSMTGGLGNANSFSLFCAASFFWFYLVEKRYVYAAVVFFGVWMSGSLAALIISGITAVFVFTIFQSTMLLLVSSILGAAAINYFSGSFIALNHAFRKLLVLVDYVVNGNVDGSQSVSGRVDFLAQGLNMMSEDMLSWFWGHPGGLIMYSGDGYFTAILVTHGIIVLLLFVMCLFVLLTRRVSGSPDLGRFSQSLLLTISLYLIANRILDYYPAALLLMLSASYIMSFSRGFSHRH